MPLFSIITVCYNDLNNLKKTVVSTLNQNFRDFEYIIIDGSSTDGSVHYIKTIPKVKYISGPDNGIFDAMNKGLQLCKGDFVCFMNAGDTFTADTVLATVSDEIKQNGDISFFYGDVNVAYHPRKFIKHPDVLRKFFLFRTTICHQVWFLKQEIYKQIGCFDLTLEYQGDYNALLTIILDKKIKYKHISVFLADYLGGGHSDSANKELYDAYTDEVRRRHFSKLEFLYFTFLLNIVNIIRLSNWWSRFVIWRNKRLSRSLYNELERTISAP